MSEVEVAVEADELEICEVTLDVRDFDHVLQRRLFISALEGATQYGVNALKARGIEVTDDTVMELAGVLRNMSAERCVFCSAENLHKTGWLVAPGVPHMPWAELAPVACACLAKYRTSRRTMIRGWESPVKQAELAKQMHDGDIDPDRIVYTDKCKAKTCERVFKVTVQNVVMGYMASKREGADGRFRGWSRCQPCETKKRLQRGEEASLIQVRRAPRKNALTPITPARKGWAGLATLGENASLKEAFERFKKGG